MTGSALASPSWRPSATPGGHSGRNGPLSTSATPLRSFWPSGRASSRGLSAPEPCSGMPGSTVGRVPYAARSRAPRRSIPTGSCRSPRPSARPARPSPAFLRASLQTTASLGSRRASMPMDDAMSAGFPPALALRIGVSVGKTEAVLDLLADPASFNLDVYYFVPEHKLSDEIADRFTMKSLARGGPPGVVIRGREQVHPSGEPMCHKSDIARQVARLGASVRHTLCETEGRGGQGDEYWEHTPARGGTCRYIAQLRTPRPAVWLMPHQYAFLPRLEGLLSPDLVVFDESFWQAALRGVDGPPSKRPFIRPDQLRTPRYIPIKGRGDPALTSHRDYDLDATEELQRISEEVANLIEDGQLSPKDMIEAGFTH